MFIAQLAYLTALAKERHFGRAAAACHVTQPTLSEGIRRLEAELGAILVRRADHRFRGFTPEGERALAWAARILADFDGLREDVSDLREGLRGPLRIGAIPTTLPALPFLTASFHERHPLVRLAIVSSNSREIERRLRHYEFDVGVTYLDNEPLSGVVPVPLYRERYVLLTPSDGPLAGQDTVTWAQAAKVPLCLLTPDMQNRRIVDAVFHEAGVEPMPVIETNSISTLCTHVRTGRFSSVMSHSWLLLFEIPPDMRALPLVEPHVTQRIGLVVPEQEPRPPVVRRFLDHAGQLGLQDRIDRSVAQGSNGDGEQPIDLTVRAVG